MLDTVKVSKILAAIVGGVFALTTVGGMMLGLVVRDGTSLALGSMTAGFTLTAYLWTRWVEKGRLLTGVNLLAAVTAVSAGLALFSNQAYALWALGYPMNLGTVTDGRMGEHFWLGPFTLLYAVASYQFMRKTKAQAS